MRGTLPELRRQIEVRRLLKQRLLGLCIISAFGYSKPLPQGSDQGLPAGIGDPGAFWARLWGLPAHGTRLTNLPGTTITRLGALPSSQRAATSLSKASFSRVALSASAGTSSWPRTLPLI